MGNEGGLPSLPAPLATPRVQMLARSKLIGGILIAPASSRLIGEILIVPAGRTTPLNTIIYHVHKQELNNVRVRTENMSLVNFLVYNSLCVINIVFFCYGAS